MERRRIWPDPQADRLSRPRQTPKTLRGELRDAFYFYLYLLFIVKVVVVIVVFVVMVIVVIVASVIKIVDVVNSAFIGVVGFFYCLGCFR